MDRSTVEVMSSVASKLALVKGKALSVQPAVYKEIRELLNDCQEIMAKHCDCAPIRLITGQVDEIMSNLEETKV